MRVMFTLCLLIIMMITCMIADDYSLLIDYNDDYMYDSDDYTLLIDNKDDYMYYSDDYKFAH